MKQFIIACFFIVMFTAARSQDLNSNINVSNLDSSFSIGPNQVLCIDSLSTFSGSITLNGGTFINKGLSTPRYFVINSGQFINKGSFYFNSTLTIVQNSSFMNANGAQFNSNSLIVNGTYTNNGLTNITNDIIINSNTSQNNSIINTYSLGGTDELLNNGIINVN